MPALILLLYTGIALGSEKEYIETIKPKFRFSGGIAKFELLCTKMKAAYLLGSGLPTTDGCKKKIDGTSIETKEKMFQTEMLEGKLPNSESIAGAQASLLFYEKIYLDFPNDPGHFDHFHLELQ